MTEWVLQLHVFYISTKKNCIVLSKTVTLHDTNIDTCFTQMRMNGKTLTTTYFCRNKHHQTTTLNPDIHVPVYYTPGFLGTN